MRYRNIMIKVIYIFVLSVLGIYTISCGETPEPQPATMPYDFSQFDYLENSYLELGDQLVLPEEDHGYSLNYIFNKPKYFNEEYQVIADEKYDVTIELVVIVVKNEYSEEKTYKFYISQNIDAFFEKVETHIRDFIKTPHRGNVKLVTTYYKEDIKVTYKSNRPDIISDEGVYTEHIYDEDVVISSTIEYRGHIHQFDINIVSIGLPFKEKMVEVKNWLDDYMTNLEISDLMKLPNTNSDHGSRIRWICEDPMVIYDYETIVLPKESLKTHLIAEIHYGTMYEIVQYEVNLPARSSDISDLDRAKLFIETVTNFENNNFINLYQGDTVLIDQSLLIDTSTANVNMTSGTHKELSQEMLDSLLYEGYELKNDENILWIIIHETGSTTVNTGALVHANLQVNNSIYGGREASWHYQVDDGKIYQSFDDSLICWHASDGSRVGTGNGSGIGIEMCVNADSEFDVAMRNDARLVAYLLNKYQLSMLNIKQHFDMAPDGKSCPEQMRQNARWFEFLTLVAREYVSQQYLSQFSITYSFDTESLNSKDIAGVYSKSANIDELDIVVTIDGEEIILKLK